MYKLGSHFASKDIDILCNIAHRMALDSFVGKITLDGYFFPCEIFAFHRYRMDLLFGGSTDNFFIQNNMIIEGPKLVNDRWIFFVYYVLFPQFKFKLICPIETELKVDET